MERASTGIRMSIGRSHVSSRTTGAESFRSIKTGNTLRLGTFKPESSTKSVSERPFTGSLFERTVPMVVPTLDFATVSDPKPSPTRVVPPTRFGEFVPKPVEFVKKTPEIKTAQFVESTPVVSEKRTVNVSERPLVQPIKPKSESHVSQNVEVAAKIKSIQNELKTIPDTKTEIKPKAQAERVETVQPEPLTVLQGDALEKKVQELVATKGKSFTKAWLRTHGHPVLEKMKISVFKKNTDQRIPITMHEETANLSKQKRAQTILTGEGPKKKQETLYFPSPLEEKKEDKEPEKENMKFVIDQKAKTARWMHVVKSTLVLIALGVVSSKYHFSGVDLDLPDAPSENEVSGLAAKMGTEDVTYSMWVAAVRKIPEMSVLGVIGAAIHAMEQVPPVDVKPEKAAKGEKSAPPSIVGLLLGTNDITSPN